MKFIFTGQKKAGRNKEMQFAQVTIRWKKDQIMRNIRLINTKSFTNVIFH